MSNADDLVTCLAGATNIEELQDYVPSTPADWIGTPPVKLAEALDDIADRLTVASGKRKKVVRGATVSTGTLNFTASASTFADGDVISPSSSSSSYTNETDEPIDVLCVFNNSRGDLVPTDRTTAGSYLVGVTFEYRIDLGAGAGFGAWTFLHRRYIRYLPQSAGQAQNDDHPTTNFVVGTVAPGDTLAIEGQMKMYLAGPQSDARFQITNMELGIITIGG